MVLRKSWLTMRGLGAIGLLAVLLIGPTPVQAHEVNLVSTLFSIGEDRQFSAEIRLKGSDVDRVAGTAIHDKASDLAKSDALAASEATIRAYFKEHALLLGVDGQACPMTVDRMIAEDDHVTTLVSWDC